MPDSQKSVYSKVGRVYRRLCTRANLRHATLKNQEVRFWAPPKQILMLISKTTLVLDLGLLKPVKLHLKFGLLPIHSTNLGLLGFFMSKAKFRERAQAAALDWLA